MKNEYRIAIVGSHSTGKTTLAKALSDTIGIPYVRGDFAMEIAHKIAPEKSMDQLLPEEHWEVQKKILEGYQNMLNNTSFFVTDATIFTWNAYTEQFVGKDRLKKNPQYTQYKKILEELRQKYSHVFYLPPEIPLKADGFRPKSNALRLSLDKAILKELSSIPYITLTGSLQNRIDLARKSLL